MSAQMRQKGRVKVGVQYSQGFRSVLVEDTFVVREGKLQEGVAPGQGIRAR